MFIIIHKSKLKNSIAPFKVIGNSTSLIRNIGEVSYYYKQNWDVPIISFKTEFNDIIINGKGEIIAIKKHGDFDNDFNSTLIKSYGLTRADIVKTKMCYEHAYNRL